MATYWHAAVYDPVVAGAPDGLDEYPHDRALKRAKAAEFDASKDPNIQGDAGHTLFISRISFATKADTLRAFCESFGQVKSFRLVLDRVTGASKGYAFCEYASSRGFEAAFSGIHGATLDGAKLLADVERGRLMPGWKPRRLGGGLGGRKESGQLRFGGRERPFRVPQPPPPPHSSRPTH